jgi:hypothetical protein
MTDHHRLIGKIAVLEFVRKPMRLSCSSGTLQLYVAVTVLVECVAPEPAPCLSDYIALLEFAAITAKLFNAACGTKPRATSGADFVDYSHASLWAWLSIWQEALEADTCCR